MKAIVRTAAGTARALLPAAIMGGLYGLSSLPGVPLVDDPDGFALFRWVPPVAQNALHVPVYAGLSWAWYWALGAWQRVPLARTFGACAAASVYGVFDEWHQSFVPGRFASLGDITLNVVGAVLGVWIANWFESRSARLQQSR